MKWAFCLLFLLGCQRQSQWHCQSIKEKSADCTRILYTSNDQVAGIDIEFLQTKSELITYLQVHSRPIFSSEQNKAKVTIQTPTKKIDCLASFHSGRQRIRLNSAVQEELISLLKEGKAVTIEVASYRETIEPKRFEKTFKKLQNPPFRKAIRLF